MQIQTVTYSRLVSGPGYSNQTIGATAFVDEGEEPENALAAVEVFVTNQHNLRRKTSDEIMQLEQSFWDKRREFSDLERKIAAATERWEAVKTVSAALGIDLTQKLGREGDDLDDIPF